MRIRVRDREDQRGDLAPPARGRRKRETGHSCYLAPEKLYTRARRYDIYLMCWGPRKTAALT